MTDEQPTNPLLPSQRMLRFEDDVAASQFEEEAQLPEEQLEFTVQEEEEEAAPGLENVHVLYASVHIPRLTYKIRDLEQNSGGVALEDGYTTGSSWKLMPNEHKKKLTNFESEVRSICAKYNTPIRTRAANTVAGDGEQHDYAESPHGRFYMKGLALVPDSRIDEMAAELDRVNTEMRDYVRNEIASDMDKLRNDVREKLGDEAYEQASQHIPNAHELLAKTCVEWILIPIALGNTEVRDLLRGKLSEFADAIAESVFSEPREELASATDSLIDLIRKDGRVTSRSLEPIRRAFEKIRSFENLGDTQLDSLIAELEVQLQREGALEDLRTARGTENDSVAHAAERSGLAEALRNISEVAATEAATFQRHGRMSRGLVFNDGGADGQTNEQTEEETSEVSL